MQARSAPAVNTPIIRLEPIVPHEIELVWSHQIVQATFSAEEMQRLCEQKQRAYEKAAALDDYLRRWWRWTTAGLDGLAVGLSFPAADPKASKTETK